mmetsp:Transcript_68018/g.221427  ORF Transcript_68018/g.221427 Transcript_68018/m.221427 type:complete len:274 (-) Transcript_68018:959-1780(-)
MRHSPSEASAALLHVKLYAQDVCSLKTSEAPGATSTCTARTNQVRWPAGPPLLEAAADDALESPTDGSAMAPSCANTPSILLAARPSTATPSVPPPPPTIEILAGEAGSNLAQQPPRTSSRRTNGTNCGGPSGSTSIDTAAAAPGVSAPDGDAAGRPRALVARACFFIRSMRRGTSAANSEEASRRTVPDRSSSEGPGLSPGDGFAAAAVEALTPSAAAALGPRGGGRAAAAPAAFAAGSHGRWSSTPAGDHCGCSTKLAMAAAAAAEEAAET